MNVKASFLIFLAQLMPERLLRTRGPGCKRNGTLAAWPGNSGQLNGPGRIICFCWPTQTKFWMRWVALLFTFD